MNANRERESEEIQLGEGGRDGKGRWEDETRRNENEPLMVLSVNGIGVDGDLGEELMEETK